MKNTYFDTDANMLYIRTSIIVPDVKGKSFKAQKELYAKALKLTFQERIARYCTEDQKVEIDREFAKHPGCLVSEFC